MKIFPALALVLTLGVLAGCEQYQVQRAKPTTAPEFMHCRDVPNSLAYADSIVRSPGYITTTELEFWKDRKDRLVKRAWECKS